MKVPEALEILAEEEAQRLVDMEKVTKTAIERVEQSGIVFLDEIDKIVGGDGTHGPDVSREGVQRDLLPIVEGSTVSTRYGMVRTDHILFIAAGAFSATKPSDLIPELQGRFPIRVELNSLGRDEFIRILTEPHNALIKQYTEMMATEGGPDHLYGGCDCRDCGDGHAGERPDGEHRGAASLYDHGEPSRRNLL